jgi:hypothetical protein
MPSLSLLDFLGILQFVLAPDLFYTIERFIRQGYFLEVLQQMLRSVAFFASRGCTDIYALKIAARTFKSHGLSGISLEEIQEFGD